MVGHGVKELDEVELIDQRVGHIDEGSRELLGFDHGVHASCCS
jgi:hypothetical protein